MISGTFEYETHTNKQPDLITNKIYEYNLRLLGNIPIKILLTTKVPKNALKCLEASL